MKNKNTIGIFYKLFFTAAIFFAVFVLAELGNNFWAVGAAGIVLLIAAYLYLSNNEKDKQTEKEERAQEKRELYERLEELLNVEKAVYTAVKRGDDKLEKQLASMTGEGNAKEQEILLRTAQAQEQMLAESRRLAEIQVNALKTVAKYNKENARQLALIINENADKLGEKLQNAAIAPQGNTADEVMNAAANTEESYQEVQEEIEAEPTQEEILVPEPEPEIVDEPISVPFPEPSPEPASTPSAPQPPVMDDPNRAMSPDEIAALIASMGGGADTEPTSDPSPEPEPEVVDEPISVPLPEPSPEPVSTSSAPQPPIMDDPNRAMSPDEIAALIASMGGGADTEPTSDPSPEPASTSSAPQPPVMDDPNRAMSPDEIAALIASMGK